MGRYRVKNWAEYNASLVKRGSLTIWISPEAIEAWREASKSGGPGRPYVYSKDAILMMLILRERYRLPLRAVQGFVASIFALMGVDLPVPSYTQICRRASSLGKVLVCFSKGKITDLVLDSTGLKVYGEGEWKVRTHGKSKRRTWKKLHVAINPATHEVVFCKLTGRDGGDAATGAEMLKGSSIKPKRVLGDGGCDGAVFREAVWDKGGEIVVPPPRNAKYKYAEDGWEKSRDVAIAEILGLGGGEEARKLWKGLIGYHQRSLVETAIYRFKQTFGGDLKSRTEKNQKVEVEVKCFILNKITSLGMPVGQWERATV